MSVKPVHIPGDPRAQCDRCGFVMHLSELKKEWTGFMVCSKCFELQHPQEFVHGVEDRQFMENMRHVTTSDEATFVTKTFPPDTSHL